MRILTYVIGDGFPTTLAAAQNGSEDAFAVLWRDANPALLRYLWVAAHEATEDVAAEVWVQVIRGTVELNGETLRAGDGAAARDESALTVAALDDAEILLFDLP